jgi:calcineurin-like phosphoesterase
MTGPVNSVIGMEKAPVIVRFLTQMPQRYEVAKSDIEVQGAMITINARTRHCLKIERVREKVA